VKDLRRDHCLRLLDGHRFHQRPGWSAEAHGGMPDGGLSRLPRGCTSEGPLASVEFNFVTELRYVRGRVKLRDGLTGGRLRARGAC